MKIENLKKGVYEHTNFFKMTKVTTVPDSDVWRLLPYRGVVTTQGDVIEAEYINTLAKAGVWWVTSVRDNTVSVVDRFKTDLELELGVFDGLKIKTFIPVTNSTTVELAIGANNYVVKKSSGGALQELAPGDLVVNKIYTFVYYKGGFVLEQETKATKTGLVS